MKSGQTGGAVCTNWGALASALGQMSDSGPRSTTRPAPAQAVAAPPSASLARRFAYAQHDSRSAPRRCPSEAVEPDPTGRFQRANRTGYTTSSRTKLVARPPTIGAAIRFIVSAPAPVDQRIGSRAAIAAIFTSSWPPVWGYGRGRPGAEAWGGRAVPQFTWPRL